MIVCSQWRVAEGSWPMSDEVMPMSDGKGLVIGGGDRQDGDSDW